MFDMHVEPLQRTGGSRTGTLYAPYMVVRATIGFDPNVTEMDDPDKVKASWGFVDATLRKGFVWCYKHEGDPKTCGVWSTDGDPSLLNDLFGHAFTTG